VGAASPPQALILQVWRADCPTTETETVYVRSRSEVTKQNWICGSNGLFRLREFKFRIICSLGCRGSVADISSWSGTIQCSFRRQYFASDPHQLYWRKFWRLFRETCLLEGRSDKNGQSSPQPQTGPTCVTDVLICFTVELSKARIVEIRISSLEGRALELWSSCKAYLKISQNLKELRSECLKIPSSEQHLSGFQRCLLDWPSMEVTAEYVSVAVVLNYNNIFYLGCHWNQNTYIWFSLQRLVEFPWKSAGLSAGSSRVSPNVDYFHRILSPLVRHHSHCLSS